VEKSPVDPQLEAARWEKVEGFILAHRSLFYANGFVTTEWRRRRGLRFGPYYRLKYRMHNVQRSIYLGPSTELAEKVRLLLAELQLRRTCRRVRAQVRASLRIEKKRLEIILRANGYYMKGFEIHRSKSRRCLPLPEQRSVRQ
jgi:hypothetical protein